MAVKKKTVVQKDKKPTKLALVTGTTGNVEGNDPRVFLASSLSYARIQHQVARDGTRRGWRAEGSHG